VGLAIIVPKGRIEDPPAPKIKIFSSAPPQTGACHRYNTYQRYSTLFREFSRKSI